MFFFGQKLTHLSQCWCERVEQLHVYGVYTPTARTCRRAMKEVGHRRIVSMHNKMQGKYWKLDKHCLGGNCISKRCGKTKDQTPFFF